jgi:hypothetical protein
VGGPVVAHADGGADGDDLRERQGHERLASEEDEGADDAAGDADGGGGRQRGEEEEDQGDPTVPGIVVGG